MFNRAVNNHSAASGRTSQPSRQAVFGPGSAGGKQENVPSQWSASSTTNLYGARGPLKPSPSAVINGPNAANYSTSAHGSKSSLTQSNKFPSSLHKADSFKDDSQRVNSFSTSTSQDAASLHDAVYFDENDFDNDSDLDLSTDYVVPKTLKEALTAPKAAPSVQPQIPPSVITYPTLPTLPPAASFEKPSVSSSAPLDWSSSPVEHKKTPPNASLLRREPVSQTHSDYFPPPKRVAPATESNTRDSKRRTLPWLQEPIQHFTPMKEPPALPTKTPKQPTPIWNKTYSAIKEEQKKARKTKKSASAESTGVSKRKVKVDFVQLSQEQKNVLDLVVSKEQSVFFTGPAGTGKSVLLRQIIAELKRKYAREPDRVAVTASTGLAACNIGGITLHSYGGIGLGKEEIPELVKKIKRNAKAKLRWQRTKFLIVDEISMVDGDLFDKLEAIARQIRNNGRPFGGIKLVITGDFFQLPPVPDSGRVSKFAFDAGTWKLSIDHTIGLTHVFRQKDPVFARMLNEMRIGKLTPESINTFKSLSRPIRYDDGIQATELFPTRTEVERSNNSKMASLPGQTQIFTAMDGGSILDINQRDKLLANCMAPIRLELRKGSQVMLIKNIDESLVNGSLGVVVNFMDDKTYSYQESNGEDGDIGGSGDEALNSFKKKLDRMKNDGPGRLWPLVRFQLADGTTRELLCQPESWKIELPNGEVQASRSQVPLILAWALSIHKAQGQTLERVKVDLAKVFEKGQAYVALSRATRQDGLQVLNFDARKVMAHPTVTRFYNDLYSVEEALAGRAGNKTGYNGDMGRGRQATRREIIDVEDDEDALFC